MSMNVQHEKSSWENDPVWDLLDRTETAEIDPLFVSNVMREVRLASGAKRSWWKRPTLVGPLLAGSMASLVAALLITLGSDEPSAGSAGVDLLPLQEELDTPHLDTLLDEEMLSQAAEDPAAFSDEALVALLSQ
jgi:hypothetical protein